MGSSFISLCVCQQQTQILLPGVSLWQVSVSCFRWTLVPSSTYGSFLDTFDKCCSAGGEESCSIFSFSVCKRFHLSPWLSYFDTKDRISTRKFHKTISMVTLTLPNHITWQNKILQVRDMKWKCWVTHFLCGYYVIFVKCWTINWPLVFWDFFVCLFCFVEVYQHTAFPQGD